VSIVATVAHLSYC